MSFFILFKDELRGFYKSKVMIILWVGMPLVSVLFHFLQPDTEGLPFISIISLVVGSIGGSLGSAMLSTSICSEKNSHVYDLFIIRPVKRYNLILSKFVAVYLCLIFATIISIIFGFIIDYITIGIPPGYILKNSFESLSISMCAMAIACSIGTFFGVSVSSVAAAAILSVYVGNQVSAISILPVIFITSLNPITFSLVIGISSTATLLLISVLIFHWQQF
jgi:ABC-2 type transport system permease protein